MSKEWQSRLVAWLHEGVAVLGLYLDAYDAPGAGLGGETIRVVQDNEAYRVALDEMARKPKKRGRPRKAPGPPGALIPVETIREDIKKAREIVEGVKDGETGRSSTSSESRSLMSTCRICERAIPTAALEIHEKNCAQGRIGYATHEARPGHQ